MKKNAFSKSRRDSRSNKNRSYPLGTRKCVSEMFDFLSLDEVIRPLKSKGADISSITQMLIAFRMATNNKDFSVRQFCSQWCKSPEILKSYHLDENIIDRTVYRTVEILGQNLTPILQKIAQRVRPFLPENLTVCMDWTTVVLWGFKSDLGAYGYSRDKRDDKQQITIGAALTSMPYCIPLGMTVEPGNMCDMKHFSRTLDQIADELGEGTLIVFDKGPASKENFKALEEHGFFYLTGLKFNASIDERIKVFSQSEKNCIYQNSDENDPIYFMEIPYENHTNFLYFSEKKKLEELENIKKSVEKKYDTAIKLRKKELKSEMRQKEGKVGSSRGRKKKDENDFIITKQTVQTELLDDVSKDEAIELGIQRKLTGREGFFILSTNKNLTAEDALRIYREKDAIEKFFYSLKNEISLGPIRFWRENSVKGICIIAYLAHLFVALARIFIPKLKHVSDKIIISSLKNLTETFDYRGKKIVNRIYSNIDRINSAIMHLKLPQNWRRPSG